MLHLCKHFDVLFSYPSRNLLKFFFTLLFASVCVYFSSQSVRSADPLAPGPDQLPKAMDLLNLSDFHLLHSPKSCGPTPHVPVLVKNAAANVDQRMDIRTSWGRGSSVYFLLGRTNNATLQLHIDSEASVFQDILQGSFVDAYRNLTYKSIMGLAWAADECSSEYIMKIDDDLQVNPSNFQRFLLAIDYQQRLDARRNGSDRQFAEGSRPTSVHCAVRKQDEGVIRDADIKWYLDEEESARFTDGLYPTYCNGQAVIYSRRSIPLLVDQIASVPFFWIDDVYDTGLLRDHANLTEPRQVDRRLIYDDERDSADEDPMQNLLFGRVSFD